MLNALSMAIVIDGASAGHAGALSGETNRPFSRYNAPANPRLLRHAGGEGRAFGEHGSGAGYTSGR
jgi:hypothetical protein